MKFLASLRMNDRHGIAREARFYGEHSEWRLRGFSGGLDYEHDGVCRAVLAFVKEALIAYELDGIEFDFMRFCHMFHPSGVEGNAPFLTDMMRRSRDILDDTAARRRVDRLILSVRVPQTLDECRTLGLDVAAWISKGLVDYVCPMDFFYTDMNIRTEDFVALTEGTPCKVLPGIHPLI